MGARDTSIAAAALIAGSGATPADAPRQTDGVAVAPHTGGATASAGSRVPTTCDALIARQASASR